MIGLQALAEYATLIYANGIRASIGITESSSNTQIAQFELNNGNSFVEFTERVPRVTDITMTSNGTGCFLMQVDGVFYIELLSKFKAPYEIMLQLHSPIVLRRK